MIGNTHNRTKMPTKYRSLAKDGTTTLTVAYPKIKKIGNNQKCPCESGKKYKKCCKKNVILNKVHKLHSWRMEDDKQGRISHWWAALRSK